MSPAIAESTYIEFLKAKAAVSPATGFDVDVADLHPNLYKHQKMLVKWALKLGRRGRAAELNPGYFLDGVKYLEAEERQRDMPSLFDLEGAA